MGIFVNRNIFWAGKQAGGWLELFSLAHTYYMAYSIPSKIERFLLNCLYLYVDVFHFLPNHVARVWAYALSNAM